MYSHQKYVVLKKKILIKRAIFDMIFCSGSEILPKNLLQLTQNIAFMCNPASNNAIITTRSHIRQAFKFPKPLKKIKL